ncbi:2-succinyl-6-hydroxy-2, 4-cyclohexadiene-1-carboxylate synthase [Klebsiella michiganensis]|uniref:2-succinyl-6-hydroxy-2, 4-cyclohexadiene-1-carboxylate synthase n=1 Tax=Klebsiella michiganensis TaxID=1134687 RepID=A0A7H4PPB7_9ENTR|nr:2-succinyl-6-hydroxy-2, 4-cyclohexadiene-1-carboxylate synthase [Klebsiella michiganensis]
MSGARWGRRLARIRVSILTCLATADRRIITVNHFADVSELIKNTLNSYNILKYWLVGYSLGGRVAMFYVSQPREGLCGLVVEGGHPGPGGMITSVGCAGTAMPPG